MLRTLWPTSRKSRLTLLIAIVIVIAAAAVIYSRRDTLPSLQKMGISPPIAQLASVMEGAAWQAGTVNEEGFAQVADNGDFALWLEPKTSQIAVMDKQSGYQWRSNPSKEQLANETVKGALLENLQSPFVVEVVAAGQTRRTSLNSLTKGLSVSYTLMDDLGVQATYTYGKEQISFVIQYKLTSRGMEATIPSNGIQESGDRLIYSIHLLPFFGAVSAKSDTGYLFVPDGPGGLIYYDRVRPAIGSSYEFPVYGDDPAQINFEEENEVRREQIAFPLYGLKRGDHAFAAIVKEGPYTAKIKAATPGNASKYHSVSVSFNYREEYGRKVSGITKETVKAIRVERSREDRRVEFRLLSGEEADYVGMANAYRDYLEESGQLGGQLPTTDHIPLMLSIVGGGTKPQFGSNGYEAATTFNEAEQIVDGLREAGVANMNVIYQGWQNSGHAYTDERFPIVSKIGGIQGAKQFVRNMHEKGIKVLFDDYMAWKEEDYSSFYKKSDGIRSIDSTVMSGEGDSFIVNPVKAVRQQKQVVDVLKEIGIDGIHYVDGPGSITFSDYRSNNPLTRSDTVYYYQELLDYVREQLNVVSVARGEQYALKHVDYIDGLPYSSSRDLMIDETVPVYPIAVHGTVAYTTVAGNTRDIYEDELLKAIEYGAVPSFKLTYAESRVLKRTDFQNVYSSQYAIWKDRIVEDYEKFDQLAAVYHLKIVDHEKLADGIYATTYENGTRVTVDYKTKQFSVEGGKAG
ncbi:DUF5696 domain-containing protein [Cohnella herbarum]|uniref:Uncharacterized protein n=1 Tax=Cohnella herbarum TaxID=2728023 RepID=A0A7Z2ZJA5_9BACL|nr:DUF5696 domain-containing protein [Cohnella herbarum]QJD82011.1 hypothetical protein HH215_01650 [Cohnella herbarum]